MFTLTNRVAAIGLKNGKLFNTKTSLNIVVQCYRTASVKLTPHDVNILYQKVINQINVINSLFFLSFWRAGQSNPL